MFIYRRTERCREGSTGSRYTTPITLSVLSASQKAQSKGYLWKPQLDMWIANK